MVTNSLGVLSGDVIHLDLLGQSMIVLGSLQAASDLTEKKSTNNSDRPSSVMVDLYVLDTVHGVHQQH